MLGPVLVEAGYSANDLMTLAMQVCRMVEFNFY